MDNVKMKCYLCFNETSLPRMCPSCQYSICPNCINIMKPKYNGCPFCKRKFIDIKTGKEIQDYIPPNCPTHKVPLEKYCPNYDEIICKKCELEKHKDCKNHRPINTQMIDNIDEMYTESVHLLESLEPKFKTLEENVQRKIQSYTKNLENKIKSLTEKQKIEIENSIRLKLENKENEFSTYQNDLTRYKRKLEDLRNSEDNIDKITQYIETKDKIDAIMAKLNNTQINKNINFSDINTNFLKPGFFECSLMFEIGSKLEDLKKINYKFSFMHLKRRWDFYLVGDNLERNVFLKYEFKGNKENKDNKDNNKDDNKDDNELDIKEINVKLTLIGDDKFFPTINYSIRTYDFQDENKNFYDLGKKAKDLISYSKSDAKKRRMVYFLFKFNYGNLYYSDLIKEFDNNK